MKETVGWVLVSIMLVMAVIEFVAHLRAVEHMRRLDQRAWNVAAVDVDYWLYGPAGPITIRPRFYLWYLLVTRRRLDAAALRVAEEDRRRGRG
ncbi:hypothetical protein GCM10022215_13400 [Nocardioides fonticola]|uniref:Uncharacterized protein n=1 Tax=Nocardioides fonticola TaxID=450363 RepID=A0ABP7XGL0_9ACTN